MQIQRNYCFSWAANKNERKTTRRERLAVLYITFVLLRGLQKGCARAPPVYFSFQVIDYEFLSQKFGPETLTSAAPLSALKQQTFFNDEKWGNTPRRMERNFSRKSLFVKKIGRG